VDHINKNAGFMGFFSMSAFPFMQHQGILFKSSTPKRFLSCDINLLISLTIAPLLPDY
jgi:hypothetical protein